MNGTFQVTFVSGDTFSLNGSVDLPGAYAGGGTVTLLDPEQNNEGFGYIAIAHRADSETIGAQESPQDFLEADALEALQADGSSNLLQTSATTALNTPLPLRFTVHSTRPHGEVAQVLLYDGYPDSGAPAIAAKTIHPGTHGREGTSIWFDRAPTSIRKPQRT